MDNKAALFSMGYPISSSLKEAIARVRIEEKPCSARETAPLLSSLSVGDSLFFLASEGGLSPYLPRELGIALKMNPRKGLSS